MKWGIFLHCLFNIFMFTNKRLLPPADYDAEMHYRPNNISVGLWFSRRFSHFPYISVVLVFILVIGLYVIFKFILAPCGRCYAQAKKKKQSKILKLTDEEL
jgi:hypothetical protein